MYNIQKIIEKRVSVHLHFDCLINEYIYSLALKLGSTLPPYSFRRAYIYFLEKIIIWSPVSGYALGGVSVRQISLTLMSGFKN